MRFGFLLVALVLLVGHATAQDKPKAALRLQTRHVGDKLSVVAFLDNVTDGPITLRENCVPEFNAYTWVTVEVDDKPVSLSNRNAFAVHKSEQVIESRKSVCIGEVSLTPRSDISPCLDLKPGKYTIRVKLQEYRIKGNDLGPVSAATIQVDMPKTYTYKTAGELPIKADVYRAPGDEVRPVIVWIHGGALIVGQRGGISPVQRKRYLDAGYVVVSIDYRLAPETKLKGIIEDIQDAFKWVRTKGPEEFKIDPKRIVVIGHSAGGYLTLMSGFAVEPRPQGLIAFYGYGDIDGDWYAKPDPFYRKIRPIVSKEDAYKAIGTKEIAEGNVKGRGDFYMYCRQNGLWPLLVAGHDPVKERKEFDRFCPVRNVTKDYPPTLLLHGDNDTDVPYQQSVDMAAELKRVGVEHELVTIKGGGHGFDGGKGMEDPRVVAAFERVDAFLKKYAGK